MAKIDKNVNLLDLIPERNCQWEETPEGKIDLKVPRDRRASCRERV